MKRFDELNNKDLHAAVISNDIEGVRKLLNQGIDINKKDSKGDTSLHKAVKKRNIDMIKFLLEKGAKTEEKDAGEFTPLSYAIYTHNGHFNTLKIVELLLGRGANPNQIIKENAYNGYFLIHFLTFKAAKAPDEIISEPYFNLIKLLIKNSVNLDSRIESKIANKFNGCTALDVAKDLHRNVENSSLIKLLDQMHVSPEPSNEQLKQSLIGNAIYSNSNIEDKDNFYLSHSKANKYVEEKRVDKDELAQTVRHEGSNQRNIETENSINQLTEVTQQLAMNETEAKVENNSSKAANITEPSNIVNRIELFSLQQSDNLSEGEITMRDVIKIAIKNAIKCNNFAELDSLTLNEFVKRIKKMKWIANF